MKDRFGILFLIVLIIIGNIISSCKSLDGTYTAEIITENPVLQEHLNKSVITYDFVDSLDVATISVKYGNISILPDSLRFIKVGTMAYDSYAKGDPHATRWNVVNGHWYASTKNYKILLTKK